MQGLPFHCQTKHGKFVFFVRDNCTPTASVPSSMLCNTFFFIHNKTYISLFFVFCSCIMASRVCRARKEKWFVFNSGYSVTLTSEKPKCENFGYVELNHMRNHAAGMTNNITADWEEYGSCLTTPGGRWAFRKASHAEKTQPQTAMKPQGDTWHCNSTKGSHHQTWYSYTK